MTFRIGQKVVCIKAHPEWRSTCIVPEVGRIYTVRAIDETNGLLLEEIRNPYHPLAMDYETHQLCPGEASFFVDRFRPVVERKTDTGFAILEEIRQRESEPAPKVPAHTSPVRGSLSSHQREVK